jgi:hypothetical protein
MRGASDPKSVKKENEPNKKSRQSLCKNIPCTKIKTGTITPDELARLNMIRMLEICKYAGVKSNVIINDEYDKKKHEFVYSTEWGVKSNLLLSDKRNEVKYVISIKKCM